MLVSLPPAPFFDGDRCRGEVRAVDVEGVEAVAVAGRDRAVMVFVVASKVVTLLPTAFVWLMPPLTVVVPPLKSRVLRPLPLLNCHAGQVHGRGAGKAQDVGRPRRR